MELPTAVDASSARLLVDRLSVCLGAAGLTDFRAAPPQPTTCRGRGCEGCVWQAYFAALERWRDEALRLLPCV